MRECLSCRRLDRWPRFAVATALMLFACSPASLKALALPGVTWSAVYEFASGSFLDESGNGNGLSAITGSPSFVAGRNGSNSSALQGATGIILGRSGGLAGFNPSSNQLTLSAWIKTTSSGDELIATMGRSPSSIEGEWLWGISNGKLYFWDYQGGHGFPATFTSTTTINNGQWRHVAFVRNGLTGTFYVDGIPAGSMTAAKNISYTNSDMMIGGDYRDKTLSSYWSGQLDSVSVSSGALTPAQILLLAADASVPGVETGPTNSITGLTQTSVNLMGGITNLGGTTVTNAGFYLNTNSPATNGVKYSAPRTSFGLGSFSNTITGLTPGTSYYYRAFAANSVGTGYGANEYSFTTPSPSPFTYTTSTTGVTITGYAGTGGNVVIPATIGGFSVTKIADSAFSFRTTLTNITIPDSVLEVGQNAFYGCSGLLSASIGNGVTTLPRNTFSECVGLASVSLGANVKTLGDYAFNNCKKLTTITFPAGFESMGTRAFALCEELTSITFPQSVTAIGSEAFYGCTKLATVYFQGNTPPAVEWGAFNGIANGAKGYYPSTASTAWRGITAYNDLTLVHPDIESPVITLLGTNPLEIYKGATFSDPGATVTDNKDSTRNITGSGTVDTAAVGIYTMTYTAQDAAGNLALPVTRTVNVVLNPSGDEDGDGLTNGAEILGGTSPYQKDSDNDGVNDSVEIADGTNPTNPDSFNNLNRGLVAYYPFNGNAKDLSGSGNDGTPINAVLAADRFGDAGSTYAFNGTDSRILTSTHNNLPAGKQDCSIIVWAMVDQPIAGDWRFLLGNRGYDTFQIGLGTDILNEKRIQVHVGNGTEIMTQNLVWEDKRWYQIAAVMQSGVVSIFRDGVKLASINLGASGNDWGNTAQEDWLNLSFGARDNSGAWGGAYGSFSHPWKGGLDDIRIYSRALSEADVGQLYSLEAPNHAPVITGQSRTYDALAEFIAGPNLQSANSRWQYLGGNVSALTLLGNWKTAGNEIIQNQSQWDGNSGYLNNYPFVQRVNSATGPTSANTLVIHPSNLEEVNRAVAIGWKNTSGQTVAANFNVNLRLPYGSANGIDYKLQRGLAGSSRYLSIRSGSLQAGGSVALASDALLEMQAGEMLYLIVDSKNIFDYDHTEVSAFTVTVAGGANLISISEGTVPASNPGTAVTVLTATSSDADSGALKGIAVTGVDTSHGSWEYTLNGGNIWDSLNGVSLNSARLLKSDAQHRVRFVPNANFSGNAEIRYQAWDQTSGEDGALADLTAVGGGAWVLVAYGANASLGGFLTGPSGSFSSSARNGSAVLPGSLDILKNSMELAMTWTASGGSLPSGGIGSYTHGIAFELPDAAGMSFDGSASTPVIYYNGNSYNPLDSSFAVGSSSPDQSLVNVRTLVGSPGMPSQMYLRNKTFGAGYGGVYGLVMNDGSNAQLDYGQVPDSQTFKAVYLDHGTGAAQGQGLVMGGSGGASNSYVPSTMALWARLDPLQVLALSGGNPVSSSGNYLLGGISTSYVDVIDFDASGAFSAETATGTIRVLDTSVPVITMIGANPLQIYKGSAFSDPGATVTDNADATRTITGSGTVNTAAVGIYALTYTATDAAGNPAVQVTRTVNVVLDPSGDEDGDGVSNGAESSAGTNPLVKNILRFQTIDMLALGKGNFSIAESNGGGGAPVGFRYGTPAYYGGVPFFITDQSDQVWHAARAPGGNGTGVVSETFPIAVNNVYGFYTLAGLWWGVAGSYVTYTFNFSDGSSYSKELANNVDLRDFNIPSSFANSINGTTTQNVFASGNYHLDRQWIDFAAAGHGGKNLISFTVTDRGAWGSSRIFLAAATAQVGAPGQIPPGATDTDGDGILDNYELGLPLSTKPDDADTDDDGLSDGIEVGGVTDPLNPDSDNDGLRDGEEVITYGSNPNIVDTDGDTLLDGAEVALGTNPTNPDTDGDKVPDGVEATNGTSPLNPASNPLPAITTQLLGGTKNQGDSWTFTVNATDPTGTFLVYQWKKNGVNLGGGTFDNFLTISSLQFSDAGNYEVIVSNPLGSTTSSVVTLVVNPRLVVPATIALSTAAGSYTLLQGAVPLDNSLTVSGGETFSGATIQIETGFASGDMLNLTPSIEGITGIYDGSKGILTLSGSASASAYQSALRAVTFSTTSTSIAERGFKVTLGSAISFGGHYYEYVPGSHSWTGARTLALSKTFNGLSGYLANLTSADENNFVKTKIGTDVWIGGSDEGTEGVWKWMDGPEAGITFWNGLSGGSAPSGRYANWSSGEPNQAGDEDYAQFYVGTGNWNDLPSGSRLGFLVEYGTDTPAIQTFSGTRTFSVTKATPTITAVPTAAPISYGQTLGSSTLSGGSTSVPGRFAFTTPSTAPSVGTASQSVTFTPKDTANYNTVTTSVSVAVSKATPTINPGLSASAIAFGQTLANSSLSGSASVNGTAVAGTFAFTTPSTAPNAGTASQNVTFSPTETANYNTVTTNVSVTVSRATPTINLGLSASAIAFGQTLANSSLSGSASVNGTVVAGTFAFTTPSTAPNVGTAGQGVTFTPIDRANYNTVTASVSVTVNQALVSSGFSHTLYLGAGATTVTAWGLNTDGRLGVGDMNSPVNWAKAVQGIPVGVTVDALSAGGTHSLILAGGQVYAAGSDRFGQLGQGAVNGANKTSFTPVVVPSSTPVAVAAGGNHSLIVTADGKVFACGDNTYGQLARSSTTASSGTLVEVNFPGLSSKIVSVAAGADHNLAVDEDGGVWVWGRNNYGQLGKGNRSVAERTPSELNLGDGVFAEFAAAGFSHSLILTTDGEVLGFGRNNSGQTGQVATTSVVTVPSPIYKGLIELSEIRSISVGTDSSFAITESGQLYSWGYNAYGELLLGYASPVNSPAVYGPKPSPICTNVFNVSGGGYSSLAVGAQGVVFGGRNDVGQSGNGPDPEQVVGDYYYGAGNLTLNNLTMDLAGTTETLYDQIFVGSGTATLNGILNLMFVGSYTGPVYGSTQMFDLIWAKNGIVFGAGYQIAFNQSGYLAETERVAKDGGEVLRATIRAVVTASDLAKAVDLARPNLDGVESVSYEGSTGLGLRTLSVSPGVEMIYSYERPTGGVSSGAQYFVNGITYRVEQVSSLTGAWGDALVSGTTVTPVGNGYERATLRISSSGGAGFLRLHVESPQATEINAGVGSAVTY